MKRRSSAGSRRSVTPKGRNAPKATRNRGASIAGQETAAARLTHERDEALLREAANSEVLRLISKSPGDVELVFRTILENATRICNANFGTLLLFENGVFRRIAHQNAPQRLAGEWEKSAVFSPMPGGALDRLAKTKKTVHVNAKTDSVVGLLAGLADARTLLQVPMLSEDKLIGSIGIYRQEIRPFTDKQIALVENFAAQAVIAIENARLLNELRQRTTDLTESLERQTATSEVLKVISSSPGELDLVFQAMLENSVRICGAKFGQLFSHKDNAFRLVTQLHTPLALTEFEQQRGDFRPIPGGTLERLVRTKQVIAVADLAADYPSNPATQFGGARSYIAVPMLKEEELIGVIVIYHQEVHPFTEKQIELVQNFAAQAVIAIESTRLLNELRQRTADLSESLDQQTATSEVLKVISSAPGELNAVFEAILSNATRICEATYGNLLLRENGGFRRAAQCNAPQELIDEFQRNPVFVPLPNNPLDRVLKTKETVHTVDAQAESNLGLLANARTLLNVPMLSHDELIGTISIYRQEVRPFNDKQIALVQNFAAQAVIAIENARLLNELRQSLEQQVATGEILSSMSGSIADTKPVFDAIVRNLLRLFGTRFATIMLLQDGIICLPAVAGEPGFERLADLFPRPLSDDSFSGRAMLLKEPFQFAPLVGNPAVPPFGQQTAREFGYNSIVFAPMIRGDQVVGAIGTARRDANPFSEQQVALLRAFADQAVIAIENARLLKELRERTEEIENLNQQLEQRVADQVGEIERMGRLRRFLPPQVADLIVASGREKQLESHRREITALFCDLRGFTGFSESSDPEDVMALLRDYHAAIGQIIIKYSGTLERYAGDGVMVVFNDPVPVENPALQAVLMALEMRDAIGALTETWHRWGHDIGFGIGIAHGFATLGTIGFEGRFDYAAIGTVSNVASRLCDEAKPGQILISPRVLTKVENAVTVEPVGEFTLKGIRRPMTAYNVVEASPSKPN